MFRAILHWFLTHGLMIMFAAGGAALPSAGSGEAGSGSGGGTGTGSGGSSGGSPTPTGAPGGSPTPTGAGAGSGSPTPTPGQGQGSAVDWATAPAHFRTAYEQAQSEIARWKELGVEHNIAATYVQNTQRMIGEAYKIGRQLQYSDSDIQEALSNDLVGTLAFLRSAAARSGQGQGGQPGQGQRQGQIDPSIKKLLDERLSPIEEHTNAAMADAANQAFTGEFNRLFTDHYKADAQSYPKEYRDLLFDAVSEVFKYNDKGMHSLKFARDVSSVAETFRTVEARFAQAFNAYHMYQLGKSGQPQPPRPGAPGAGGQPGQQGKNPWEGLTLDDIATGDDRAVKLIPSMR